MADYIDREELLKYAVGLKENEKVVFEDVIEDMTSVDAVAVVRCKDCKKRNSLKYCQRHDFFISDDYYCASGVKKNE